MERAEFRFSLAVLISFFLHIVLFVALVSPRMGSLLSAGDSLKKNMFRGRDVIVNINPDDRKVETSKTLLSDKDSSAKGFITKEKGDQWLNNSRDFVMKRGGKSRGEAESRKVTVKEAKKTIILADESEVVVLLEKDIKKNEKETGDRIGDMGMAEQVLIPDKKNVTRRNAIFYSNTGAFSFNTAKYKNFHYFKAMKDKIARNWYPPIMANAVYGGYDPITGGYAPGRTRIMAIPSQEVKIVFTMNRDGTVTGVYLLDSYGNRSLDESCMDAIRKSENFGKVPEDISGEEVAIPFIFGYYVY